MIMSDIMSRRIWKAVSPLIATIILIAVTIAIAAIVIAWVYGIIGPTTATPEKLQIYPDARLINTTTQVIFNVTVKNAGGVAISLSKVYIREAPSCSANIQSPFKDPNTQQTSPSLSPGEVKVLDVSFSGCSVSPGATYTVVIVTQSGQAYYVTVTAEQGS